MTKYKYDYVRLDITEENLHALNVGLDNDVAAINIMIKELINERAKDGWEPLYPFSVPELWFRKKKKTKKN